MIEILKTILFGIIEGVTEWLPISSTGHMILLDEFIKLNVSAAFKEMFLVVIQLGAILAVITSFWNKIMPFSMDGKSVIKKDIFVMWIKIIFACIPAAVVGILWDDKFEALFYNYKTVAIMLILVGILFLLAENYNKKKISKINTISQITFKAAFIVGIFQLIAAVFPGTSRSGATILGGIMIGMSRTIAAEFTFFMAIPVMFGASLLKLLKFGLAFTQYELLILIIGMASAFIVSVIVIRFLMQYIKRNDFKVFGWYRIVLGIIVLLYFGIR